MAQQYIVLPPPGEPQPVATPTLRRLGLEERRAKQDDLRHANLEYAYQSKPRRRIRHVPVTVVGELPDGTAKLVEVPDGARGRLRLPTPGTRLFEPRTYRPAVPVEETTPALPATGGEPIEFEIRCASSSSPVAGATVTAIVDATSGEGAKGVTDAAGKVSLQLGPQPVSLASLRVKAPARGWWGAATAALTVSNPHAVPLTPVDLSVPDALRHFYGTDLGQRGKDGGGVRVAVIDTGIAEHPDLSIHGGANTVLTEPNQRCGDNGIGHGTHVAGIIAARGNPPTGLRGLAPAVELWCFRVYPEGSRTASNFDIYTAITQAIAADCDILNLSFEAPDLDGALDDGVKRAHANGAVVIAAAGNGERQAVSTPARYATAVTALGRRATYPTGSIQECYVAQPTGTDPQDFLAGFSNLGQEVTLTAPGLGIVSTVPGGYAPDDGTSMATAAATGMAARLLSAEPRILAMPRDADRSAAIRNLLGKSARSMGMGLPAEGHGML